ENARLADGSWPGWEPGSTHEIRFLTGTTLAGDKVRTLAASFEVLDPEGPGEPTEPPGPGEPPSWDHETVSITDPGTGGTATAWVQRSVEAGDGQTITVKGTGWVDQAGTGGSTIAIKLNRGDSEQYTRSGDGIVQHPSAVGDDTIWALLAPTDPADHPNVHLIGADGNFEVTLDAPDGLVAGQYLTVLFQSGRFDAADVTRAVTSGFLVVGGQAYDGGDDPAPEATCVPSTPTPQHTITNPQVGLGGTLKVSGTGWCHPDEARGGSIIAIKLDEGAYSHLTSDLHQNRTIWAIVEADAATGDWSVDLELPDGATSGERGSSPAFPSGGHTLRFLTGSLKAGDQVRTVESTEFVVGEYAPNGVPDPLDYGAVFVEAARGGMAVTRTASSLVVTLPGAQAGDWVYLSAYLENGSPRLLWAGAWFQADAAGKVTAPLAGVTLPVGNLKLVAQSGNQGVFGELLGWVWLEVKAPDDPPTDPGPTPPPTSAPTPTPTPTASSGTGGQTGTSVTQSITYANRTTTSAQAPSTLPAAPVATLALLTEANVGALTAVQDGTVITVTVPDQAAGAWVYLYVYTALQAVPVGWIQLDADLRVKADLAALPVGDHKLAVVDESGALLGWVSAVVDGATGSTIEPSAEPSATAQPSDAATPSSAEPTQQATPAAGGLRPADWWLLGGGAAVLVTLVSLAAALRPGRVRVRTGSAR
ncbi:MAG: hypothetical protein LBD51_08535, partial [Bifidobacteriaceae bacterium]|nr:hypothetical protein [Bifidobacteriaceae bacterium]